MLMVAVVGLNIALHRMVALVITGNRQNLGTDLFCMTCVVGGFLTTLLDLWLRIGACRKSFPADCSRFEAVD
jgi:hypothetical protein